MNFKKNVGILGIAFLSLFLSNASFGQRGGEDTQEAIDAAAMEKLLMLSEPRAKAIANLLEHAESVSRVLTDLKEKAARLKAGGPMSGKEQRFFSSEDTDKLDSHILALRDTATRESFLIFSKSLGLGELESSPNQTKEIESVLDGIDRFVEMQEANLRRRVSDLLERQLDLAAEEMVKTASHSDPIQFRNFIRHILFSSNVKASNEKLIKRVKDSEFLISRVGSISTIEELNLYLYLSDLYAALGDKAEVSEYLEKVLSLQDDPSLKEHVSFFQIEDRLNDSNSFTALFRLSVSAYRGSEKFRKFYDLVNFKL